MSDFSQEYREIFSNGLADESYPAEGFCVQLPNGWYGLHSIIDQVADELKREGYDDLMIPSVSTDAIYKKVPEKFKLGVDDSVFKITHTGLDELTQPYYMEARPDLALPSVESVHARSYKNLPIRRYIGGFRYFESSSKDHYSYITDREISCADFVGIFATEEQYKEEIRKNLEIIHKVLEDKCKIKTFTVKRDHNVSVCSPLPNGKILEIVLIRLFGQELAEGVEFAVTGMNNAPMHPFIFDINITSRPFASVVLAHYNQRIVLPSHNLRSHGVAFNIKLEIPGIRIDNIRKDFTAELNKRYVSQGSIFSIYKKSENVVKVVSARGDEKELSMTELESYLKELINRNDSEIQNRYNSMFDKFISHVSIIEGENPSGEGVYLGQLVENKLDVFSSSSKRVYAVPLVPLYL